MNSKRIAISFAIALAPLVASAGTIIGVKTTPASATLPANGSVLVTHEFDIKYFNNEKFPCNAKLTFSDGSPAESISIQQPMMKYTRTRTYTKAGTFDVTLTGEQKGNVVGCLGSQSSIVTIKSNAPQISVTGVTVAPGLALLPKITGVTVTDNNNAQGGPTFYIAVNGTGDVDCGLKVDIFRSTDNYNYGNNTLWSNKTPSGYWKNLTFTAAKAPGIGYKVKVYGAGNTPCGGTAETTIAPPSSAVGLWQASTPKAVYAVGEKVPVTLKFVGGPCMYDVNIHKAQGGDNAIAGFYNPAGGLTNTWDDFQTVNGSPFTPGDWSIVFKRNPNPYNNAPACAPNPSTLIVNFKVQ